MKYPTLLAEIRAEQMNPGCLQSGRRWPPSENKSKTKSPDSDQIVNNFFIWGKPITKSTQMNQRLITNNSVQQLNNRAMIKVLINKSSRQNVNAQLTKTNDETQDADSNRNQNEVAVSKNSTAAWRESWIPARTTNP